MTGDNNQPAPVPARAPEGASGPRTGLTLSGGGFRATLFHLGVVRFLYEEGLLANVTHVCSVSGGSVLAAHLVLNWERYTGTPEQFDAAAGELVAFVRADVRGRVIRPWVVSFLAVAPRFRGARWWRTALLQREYDRLYRGATLGAVAAPGRPEVQLLATSFTTGHLVAFGSNRGNVELRFGQEPGAGPDDRQAVPVPVPVAAVPVGLAVAASSAFPPLFPPVRVDHATFGVAPDCFPRPHYLTDGGVYDNLGTRRMLQLFPPNERLDLLVVSDAQRALAAEYGNDYSLITGRTSRCVDLMMDRVSWFEHGYARERLRSGGRLLHCTLPQAAADVIDRPYAPGPSEQLAVATARTDLDAFSDDEIDAIVHQGYAAARTRAEAQEVRSRERAERPVWHPARADRPPGYRLKGIDRRGWGVFRAGHWATWTLWGLLAWWLILLPGGVYGYQVYRTHQEEQRARKANDEKDAAARALDAEREQVQRREAARKWQEAHTAKKVRLIRALGEVALAAEEDWGARRLEWEVLKDELTRDGDRYFVSFFERPEVGKADAAVRTWPRPRGTHQLVFAVAKIIRDDIKNMGRPSVFFPPPPGEETAVPSYLVLLRENRASLFRQAQDAVSMIAKDGKKLTDTPNSRKQFWRLYWCDLILVEQDKVAGAMSAFGTLLQSWEQKGVKESDEAPAGLKPQLQTAARELEQACAEELKTELK
ncbi:patatin-like phospholipase family protein [Gemmata sp. G18]|uniref:Patatin-like phospholipase family protein n=1 Tax=Gemmata palustris TaxID=2822762 RepID=A0ABS5BK47_9BACT|nr:patatin-like phospholipase family protein [Gemmata palustris]MBP3954079.1 patatin-like phospholipase family protein [Gemmata palustris]